jgi:hypothetical protein
MSDRTPFVCVCSHDEADHAPGCCGDSGECGCSGFQPMNSDEYEHAKARATMSGRPVSANQRAFLKARGYKGEVTDLFHAWTLICEIKSKDAAKQK